MPETQINDFLLKKHIRANEINRSYTNFQKAYDKWPTRHAWQESPGQLNATTSAFDLSTRGGTIIGEELRQAEVASRVVNKGAPHKRIFILTYKYGHVPTWFYLALTYLLSFLPTSKVSYFAKPLL